MHLIRRIAITVTLFAAFSANAGESLCGDVKVVHFKAEAAKLVRGNNVEVVVASLRSAASRKGPKAEEAGALVAAVESARNALKDDIRSNVKLRPGLAFIQLETLVKTWPSERTHCSKLLQKLSESEEVQTAVNFRRALEAEASASQAVSNSKDKKLQAKYKKLKSDRRAAFLAALPLVKSDFQGVAKGVAKEIAELIVVTEIHEDINVNIDKETPIIVIGDDKFIERTKEALSLIEKEASSFYELVTNYISIIRRGECSGMRAFDPLPTFQVGRTAQSPSLQWYASAIVHDAYHSKLYNDYVKTSGRPVPSNIWTGREAENACLSVQEDFLKVVHAPKKRIETVRKMRNVDYFSKKVKRTW